MRTHLCIAATLAVLLFCATSLVEAGLVGVTLEIHEEPHSGIVLGPLDPAPALRIKRIDNGAVYPCSITVATQLFLSAREYYGTPAPVLSGTTTVTGTDGTVILDNLMISKAGSFYQLGYTVSAVVESTTLTWTRYSGAFNIAGTAAPTTTVAATTTAAPTTTAVPPTPHPRDLIDVVVTAPQGVTNCNPFTVQPTVTLINTTTQQRADNVEFTATTQAAVNTPAGASTTLSGTTDISGTGTGAWSGLQVCGDVGFGYSLSHSVSFMGRTVNVTSGSFAVAGTASPVPTTTAAAPTTTAAPAVDLSNAVVRFILEPGSGVAGNQLRVQPIVRIEKPFMNEIIPVDCSATVSLMWSSRVFGPTYTAAVTGTLTVSSNNGVMPFTDLAIDKPGYGYNLKVVVTAGTYTWTVYSTVIYIVAANNMVADASHTAAAGTLGYNGAPTSDGGSFAPTDASTPGTQGNNKGDENGGNGDAESTAEADLKREQFLLVAMVVLACVAMVIPIVVFVLTRNHYATALEKQVEKQKQQKYEGVPLQDMPSPVPVGASGLKKTANPVALTFATMYDAEEDEKEGDDETPNSQPGEPLHQ